MKTLPTQNESWGFWGTMGGDASAAWPVAMQIISDATALPVESVRAFLDSRDGRHFADEVQDKIFFGAALADAVKATTATWMGWTIGRRTSRNTGIPKGLPYLTGFVINAEITEG